MYKLSYRVRFPKELEEIYEFLQKEMNRVLNDKEMRDKISEVDSGLMNGEYWKQMRIAIGEKTQYRWKEEKIMPNASKYFCAFAEQIRQVQKSQKDQKKLYEALQKFGNEDTEEFYEYCHKNNIQYSKNKIKNLQRCKSEPEMAKEVRFVLDFAVINNQTAYLDGDNVFHYQVYNKDKKIEWKELPIIMHLSSKYEIEARISKPRFSKDRDGNYYGTITFDYERRVFDGEGKNIGAIDLGKINLFTFSYVAPNGEYSEDYYKNSKKLDSLNKKVQKLEEERESLINKNNKTNDLLKGDVQYTTEGFRRKYEVREIEKQRISLKISNMKKNIAREMAVEILELCKMSDCKTLFMENLSWLGTTGGRWNFREQQNEIERILDMNGIDVYYVSAKNTSKEHPITKAIGKEVERDIVWSNGDRMDRDRVSTLNQVQREGKRRTKNRKIEKKQGYKITKLRKKDKPTPRQLKRSFSTRRLKLKYLDSLLSKNTKRNTQMVVFYPRVSASLTNNKTGRTWSCMEKFSFTSYNNDGSFETHYSHLLPLY